MFIILTEFSKFLPDISIFLHVTIFMPKSHVNGSFHYIFNISARKRINSKYSYLHVLWGLHFQIPRRVLNNMATNARLNAYLDCIISFYNCEI